MMIAQGDIFLANLSPVRGSEQDETRPVVIVSGNTMNSVLPVIMVCPITSQCKKLSERIALTKTKANGLAKNSEVLPFHLRTIAKERLTKKLGLITHTIAGNATQDTETTYVLM